MATLDLLHCFVDRVNLRQLNSPDASLQEQTAQAHQAPCWRNMLSTVLISHTIWCTCAFIQPDDCSIAAKLLFCVVLRQASNVWLLLL
jgi:hypothetical protein